MTCDWIFEPMATMSSSRARISESRRSRLPTSTSSSSACFSSTLIRSAPAIRCASADGSSRLATAICSSSGRYGTSSMMCVNVCWTLRISAVSSGPSSTSSGSSETVRDEVGLLADPLLDAAPAGRAWTRIRSDAVGHLEHARDDARDADGVQLLGPGRLEVRVLGAEHHEHAVAGRARR